jgi:hypothetical protein
MLQIIHQITSHNHSRQHVISDVAASWCCHITYHNEIFIILNRDFSQEIYVLPADDMQDAIETCRNNESVLMCIILD